MPSPQTEIFVIVQQVYPDFCIDIVRKTVIDFNVEKFVPCHDGMIRLRQRRLLDWAES